MSVTTVVCTIKFVQFKAIVICRKDLNNVYYRNMHFENNSCMLLSAQGVLYVLKWSETISNQFSFCINATQTT